MKRLALMLLACCMAAPLALAETPREMLDRAYALSDQGRMSEAKALYLQACDAGSFDACYALENALRYDYDAPDTPGADRALQKARDLENRACEAGESGVCISLADKMFYASDANGNVKELSASDFAAMDGYMKKARRGAEQSCAKGITDACVQLGLLELQGWGGARASTGLARVETACLNGFENACWSRFALISDPDVPAPRDSNTIMAFIVKLCLAYPDMSLCQSQDDYMLQTLAAYDSVAWIDTATAIAECEAGRSAVACKLAAGAFAGSRRYQSGSDASRQRMTRQAGKIGCDAGDMQACYDYANDLQYAYNGPANIDLAKPIFERICQSSPADVGGDGLVPQSCVQMSYIIESESAAMADGSVLPAARSYVQRACDLGDTYSCDRLRPENYGYAYAAPAYDPDPLTAAELAELCRLAFAQACQEAGLPVVETVSIADSELVSVRALLVRGCDAGYLEACRSKARMMFDGAGGEKDVLGAVFEFESACFRGEGISCSDGGRIAKEGATGLLPDASRAWAMLSQGCSLDDSWSCVGAGLISNSNEGCGSRQQSSQGCLPNYPEARQFLKKGCDLGNFLGCGQLAYILEKGLAPTGEMIAVTDPSTGRAVLGPAPGIAVDLPEAERLYRKACPFYGGPGDGNACIHFGRLLTSNLIGWGREEEAARFFQQACDQDFASGCGELAILTEDGLGIKKSRKQAKALYQKACNLGNEQGCLDFQRLGG